MGSLRGGGSTLAMGLGSLEHLDSLQEKPFALSLGRRATEASEGNPPTDSGETDASPNASPAQGLRGIPPSGHPAAEPPTMGLHPGPTPSPHSSKE